MRIAFCLYDMGARFYSFLGKELISRGHQVDFLVFYPKIKHPDIIPPAARVFVLNANSDDEARAMSAAQVKQPISLQSEIETTAYLKRNIHLAITARWHYLLLPFGHRLQRMKEAEFVASYVRKEKPDCVLPSRHVAKVATFWAMKSLPQFPPVIPTIHSSVHRDSRKAMDLYSRIFERCAHVISVSDGLRDQLLARTGLPFEKVSVIHACALPPEMGELRNKAPAHPWMTDGGPPVVLAAGALNDQKDHPTLLRAFHILAKTRNLRLIILGGGELRQQTEELIRSLDLEDKVSLPGWTDNPFAFMSRAALFVLSSMKEGLGNVLIEALACGCPVVSTDCPSGPSEILEGGRIGPLVPVGDHAALADAMGRVLDDPPDREMLMQRAAFFSIDKAVDTYERLIVEAVEKP